MAVLAPPDWQYSPRDPAMDKGPEQQRQQAQSQQQQQGQQQQPQQQRPPLQQQPPLHPHPQQQPYGGAGFTQQAQGSWTPSLAAPPFYPGAFYQNPQQAPSPFAQPGVNPYFDPANAQLAQWAYQQMMFNAQQHAHMPSPQQHGHGEFFAPPPGMHGQFNPFPSGTPPPRPSDAQPQYPTGPNANANTGGGYHPYRRPTRQQSGAHSDAGSVSSSAAGDWARGPPQPPYSRPDASGSSSSVNSQGRGSSGGRARTDSNNSQSRGSAHSHSPVGSTKGSSPQPQTQGSNSSNGSGGGRSSPVPQPPRIPHTRAGSSSSTHSAHSTTSSSASPSPLSASSTNRTRPSPLSASTLPAARSPLSSSSLNPSASSARAERRISRDDSSLALSSLSLLATRAEAASSTAAAAGASGKPDASKAGKVPKGSGGMKGLGRLRRALSFNASVALKEEVGADGEGVDEEDDEEDERRASDSDESIKASVVNPKAPQGAKGKTPASRHLPRPSPASPSLSTSSSSFGTAPSSLGAASGASIASNLGGTQVPMPKKKSRAASLFNSRMNVSTDNISLSSTVSSASVMIRKLGSMGRLARRNSLAGITGLFKSKNKNKEGGDDMSDVGEGEGEAEEGDKKDKKGKKKDKKARSGKGQASEASVSHATAELESGDGGVVRGGADVAGLSPAAKLARQHTLKSNAEAAAKAKEAAARAAVAPTSAPSTPNGTATNGVNGAGVPTWDRNTATRSPGRNPQHRGAQRVGEDGSKVLVEDSESDDDHVAYPHQQGVQQQHQQQQQRWDDEDEDEWRLVDEGGEEDDTIRIAVDPNASSSSSGSQYSSSGPGPSAPFQEEGYGEGEYGYDEDGEGYGYGEGGYEGEEGGYGDDGEHEPWAVDVRRSVERTRVPTRGILKTPFSPDAGTYDQATYLPDAHGQFGSANTLLRARSNSYTSPTPGQNELGPLARMPSPDPDHIDGLHRHGSHSSAHGESANGGRGGEGVGRDGKRSSIPSLPPLGFETGGSMFDSPQVTPTAATYAAAGQSPTTPTPSATGGAHSLYAHPALNSSAPALTLTSSMGTGGVSPVPRAATAPVRKHLAFASNLSVYDTFSASMYDRRSEPATWSRLTPALAQRIKEELNSYKMEEMEVHAASRIQCVFPPYFPFLPSQSLSRC
ncbi:hypothetical protein MSAN_00819600 [Mycena sanguinolenta]|uniref:Uncharacterized protein n=1 Tax=Mycena sanguinolenta TaxID=230812 RepID=A0A8H6Z1E2_9AGAR|nr:hypothetical protein MSAN_00819600 [Mycena sanguinolenta]